MCKVHTHTHTFWGETQNQSEKNTRNGQKERLGEIRWRASGRDWEWQPEREREQEESTMKTVNQAYDRNEVYLHHYSYLKHSFNVCRILLFFFPQWSKKTANALLLIRYPWNSMQTRMWENETETCTLTSTQRTIMMSEYVVRIHFPTWTHTLPNF